jgi:WD40 repeat protein
MADNMGGIGILDLSLSPGDGIKILRVGNQGVTHLSFSSDSRWFATDDQTGAIRVWDLRHPNANPVTIGGHSQGVEGVYFGADGRCVVSYDDQTVRFWPLDVDTLLGRIKSVVARGLTPEEVAVYLKRNGGEVR